MILKVKCTLYVEVEVPNDRDPTFAIEVNSCPGTHAVGSEVQAAIEHGEAEFVCWACNLQGKNEIVEVNGMDVST